MRLPLFALLSFAAFPAFAQEAAPTSAPVVASAAQETIEPDRPDFAESTSVVPVGKLQAEFGLSLFTVNGDQTDLSTLTTPQLLLRYGYNENLEFRLVAPDFQRVAFNVLGVEAVNTGFGDMALAAKYIRPLGNIGMSIVPVLTLPVGQDGFTSDAFGFAVGANFSMDLNETIGLAWNLVASTADLLGFDGNSLDGSIGASYKISEMLSGYAEMILTDIGGETEPIFGFGGGYLLNPKARVDASALVTLDKDANDITISLGGAVLF